MNNKITREPLVSVPIDSTLGPKMRALTMPQRAFVVAMCETGGQDHSKAALMAGYGGTENSTKVAACRLAHDPRVLEAIREEAEKRLQSGAILGASVMVEIAMDKLHKDRFKAADNLLNRAGLLVETQHRVIVENDNRPIGELRAAVLEQLRGLFGKDAALPPALTAPIDGEYTEVPADDDLGDLYQ